MRFDPHSSLATLLLSLSLAGCTETSTAPLTPATHAATPMATTATSTNTAVPAKPPGGTPVEPACPADAKPVTDTAQGPGRICHGAVPAYFAQVMTRLSQSGTSTETRKPWPAENVDFTVIPGLGRRMDIMVGRGNWIRSFEGPDPAVTVYLADGLPCDGTGAPSDCKYGIKAYQVTGNAEPVDVTAYALPDEPALSDAQRTHYDETGGGNVWLDTSKLPLAPTMRWVMEFDPDRPIPESDPHDAGGVGHFGFLAWNGQRFELKDRVPRSQWPCAPVPEGRGACTSEFPEHDRFVINGK